MKSLVITLIIGLSIFLQENTVDAENSPKERVFLITQRIEIKEPAFGIEDLRVWIPYPAQDIWQSVYDFRMDGPFDMDFITDEKYHNRIIYLSLNDAQKTRSPAVYLSFKARRREDGYYDTPLDESDDLKTFLAPNRLVPVGGRMKRLAQEITKDKTGTMEKARAIYDYILKELTYLNDDPDICGIGDSLLTLEHKKGICTDYHSLFISLVRSLGIPAKFQIGLRIEEGRREGRIEGYHCWAKFYVEGRGWVPVDVSDADKHPEKSDYFFGHIDENKLHLTTGRDIVLKYAKDKDVLPLNFLVYPYIEVNGKAFGDAEISTSFKEIERR